MCLTKRLIIKIRIRYRCNIQCSRSLALYQLNLNIISRSEQNCGIRENFLAALKRTSFELAENCSNKKFCFNETNFMRNAISWSTGKRKERVVVSELRVFHRVSLWIELLRI